MGIDEARNFWEVFDSLTKTAQADYLNSRFGELLWDISRDWEDYETELEELERIRQEEINVDKEHNTIAEERKVILSTPHYSVEVKEAEDNEGVIIDIFHRHGDLIDTYTYWNDDVIDKNSQEWKGDSEDETDNTTKTFNQNEKVEEK